jgi:hypothetical protein
MSTALQSTAPQSLDAVFHLSDETLFSPEILGHALELLSSFAGPLVADVQEEAGRREINRITRAVGGAITRLDERRRAYVAALKARPKAIDDLFRTTFRQPAEALKDRIRAPLTAWEEEIRLADEHTAQVIERLNAPIIAGTTATQIQQRLADAQGTELPDWLSATQRGAIVDALNRAVPHLERAWQAARAEEERTAELARLRATEREAELAQARAEAAEAATRAAEARALAQIQAAERAAQQAAQVLQSRPPTPTPDPVPASRDTQAAIHREILADLCDLGLDEATAKIVIRAIANGHVSHVSITY